MIVKGPFFMNVEVYSNQMMRLEEKIGAHPDPVFAAVQGNDAGEVTCGF